MNYKEELIKEADMLESEANNIRLWVSKLTDDGFDWDDVTETQKWAIRNNLCPK